MRVLGLDGRTYTLATKGKEVGGADLRQRSGPHLRARALLRLLFPIVPILEEIHLPGSDGLTADFFLPSEKLMVEVHGMQHFKFNPHFHKTRAGFLASKRRDRTKSEWCEVNSLKLIILSDGEDTSEWERRIRSTFSEAEEDGEGVEGEVGPARRRPDR